MAFCIITVRRHNVLSLSEEILYSHCRKAYSILTVWKHSILSLCNAILCRYTVYSVQYRRTVISMSECILYSYCLMAFCTLTAWGQAVISQSGGILYSNRAKEVLCPLGRSLKSWPMRQWRLPQNNPISKGYFSQPLALFLFERLLIKIIIWANFTSIQMTVFLESQIHLFFQIIVQCFAGIYYIPTTADMPSKTPSKLIIK